MADTRFFLRFNNETDADIITLLRSKSNMTDYIRDLIRADALISSILDTEIISQEAVDAEIKRG